MITRILRQLFCSHRALMVKGKGLRMYTECFACGKESAGIRVEHRIAV